MCVYGPYYRYRIYYNNIIYVRKYCSSVRENARHSTCQFLTRWPCSVAGCHRARHNNIACAYKYITRAHSLVRGSADRVIFFFLYANNEYETTLKHHQPSSRNESLHFNTRFSCANKIRSRCGRKYNNVRTEKR